MHHVLTSNLLDNLHDLGCDEDLILENKFDHSYTTNMVTILTRSLMKLAIENQAGFLPFAFQLLS